MHFSQIRSTLNVVRDPHAQREQQKYDNPIPSREYILDYITSLTAPADRQQIFDALKLAGEEHEEALRRRLRAMERDGQLVFTRNKRYALPERMDLIRGTVLGHRDGFGFLRPEQGGDDLFLTENEMRALLHGDVVLVQPLEPDRRGRVMARVVRVLEGRSGQIVGRLFNDGGMNYVVPDDKRLTQDILVAGDDRAGARHGQIVVVEITKRPNRRFNPMGKVVEVLGDHMAPGMEIDMALRSHDLPHQWPAEVQQESARIGDEVPAQVKRHRVDLRQLPLVTIDGEDARDFDDAVYCQPRLDAQGQASGWTLWVAIADVSYYVRPGSPLDSEAISRGNSVYFPSQVIPMLPEALSNGLCSLNPHVDRLCMVCQMEISARGKLEKYHFYDALMNSHARFTYTKVAAILDGDQALRNEYAPLVGDLEQLHALYNVLKQRRRERGAIEFETQETRFIFNAERRIDSIVPVVRNDAHKLIEECMILANVAAARYVEANKGCALFRVHDAPGDEKLADFRKFIGELGLELKGGDKPTPKDYAQLAAELGDRPDKELIQTMLLRSMKQAVYGADCEGHFGLALEEYAHFTSPIRRYPDLVLHRTIKYLMGKKSAKNSSWVKRRGGWHYASDEMDSLGEQCSMTERRADDATRDVSDWLKCEFMQDHVGSEYHGVIAAVTGFGFFVRLDDFHIDGLVHVSSLRGDYYHFDPVHQTLSGEHSGARYRLGDVVAVQVAAVNLDDRKIDFVLAGEPLPARSGKTARDKQKKQQRQIDNPSWDRKPKAKKSRGGEQSKGGTESQHSQHSKEKPAKGRLKSAGGTVKSSRKGSITSSRQDGIRPATGSEVKPASKKRRRSGRKKTK